VRFDQDHCALRFSADWMQHALAAHDGERARVGLEALGSVEEIDLVPKLHRTLRLLLVAGRSSGDEVAQALALHRRTLNRRLRAQGTTFQKILDEVRFAVARQLLEQTQMSIPDIAAALCYSEVSAFTHAFRRWSGTTPTRWRSGVHPP